MGSLAKVSLRPIRGPPRQPALHRGVLSVPGRSSEPDLSALAPMIQAGFSPRPFVRSVKPRLSAPWQLPLRAADGPPGTPATAGVVKPAQAGHRSRLRRMTPHDSALNGPGLVLHTTS